jgi:hypothetical protein
MNQVIKILNREILISDNLAWTPLTGLQLPNRSTIFRVI